MNFTRFSILAASCALLLAASPALRAQEVSNLPLDGYAASVNDKVITIGDVMVSIYEAEQRLRILYGGTELAAKQQELFLSGLERLIDQALIVEEFKKQEAQIPERMVDDRINEIIFDRFANDRSALLDALAHDGMTLEEWRDTIRERLIVSLMRRTEIGDKVVISPRDLREAYESQKDRYAQSAEVHLRLIFMKHGDDPEATFQQMTAARAEIVAGKNFADTARSLSADPSASAGGDWGWLDPNLLRGELKTALADLPAGGLSEIVTTPEGLYLLKVEERREASTKSFDEVKSDIESELKEKESERLYQDWTRRLRDKFSVIYHIPVPPATP